jgi:hypothetical protein
MYTALCRYEDGEFGGGEPGIPAPTNSTTLRVAIHQLQSLVGWNSPAFSRLLSVQ